MNYEILGISVYVLLMLCMGFWVSRRIKNDDDYFLAGRSLGPYLATFSIFATWFGAETCIGTAGNVYREGLAGAHADPFGYALCILIMGVVFSKILWNKKITTIADLFRNRYSRSAEIFAALIMIPSSLVWSGAQIRAFGQILHTTTDFTFTIAVTVAALVVLIYTISGGLLADAYTDLIQGIALIVGLIVLGIAIYMDLGGFSGMVHILEIDKIELWRPDQMSFPARIEMWLVPILGSLMSQELVSRVVASRSAKVAYNSSLRAGVIYLIVGMLPVMIGLMGPHYLPGLDHTDSVLPMLAKKHLNFALYIIFVGALVSAILSTVDSTLLAVSALISHNLILPLKTHVSERQKVVIARLGVLFSGVTAYAIAFMSDSVTELVETASSLGGPSILVMVCFAIFTKKGNHVSAILAMSASIIAWFLTHFVIESETPIIWTVVTCLVVYLVTIPFVQESKTAEI